VHLDAGAEVARQLRDQLAEVDALLAQVVDDDVLAADTHEVVEVLDDPNAR
jgi:hypothetical protein